MTSNDDSLISAGDFSRRTGLSRKTLRGYNDIGLLRPSVVDEDNGFKYYSEPQLQLGLLLNELRSANVPRSELVHVVESLGDDMSSPSAAADAIKTFLYQEARVLRDRQASIHRVINRLANPTPGATGEIRVRSVDAHFALVGVSVCVAATIEKETQRWASRLGAVEVAAAGPLYLRFPEPVTEELSGRVQFCLPVDQPAVPPVGTSLIHTEPRDEATIIIPASADIYPATRAALERLLEWHLANHNDISGSAPEIHHESPGPGDTTVAWPYAQV